MDFFCGLVANPEAHGRIKDEILLSIDARNALEGGEFACLQPRLALQLRTDALPVHDDIIAAPEEFSRNLC
jgi:hypothetical protein